VISLRQLAKLCNVSATTASKALKDDPAISQETRQRIRTMAESLNFRPNRLANVIFSGRSQLFAAVVSRSSWEPFNALIEAAEDHAFDRGYGLLVYNTHDNVDREIQCLHHALENRVAGLIVGTANYQANKRHFWEVLEHKVPMVVFNVSLHDEGIVVVQGDNYDAATQSVRHLMDFGHQNIGHLAEPRQAIENTARYEGYRDAMIYGGLVPRGDWMRVCQWSHESGHREALNLLKSHPELTAIYCANDILALGAMEAAREVGRKVPDDLSLAGMGDLLAGRLVEPKLTTVHMNNKEIGRTAVDALLDLQGWDNSKPMPERWQNQLIAGRLVVRDSTGPAPL